MVVDSANPLRTSSGIETVSTDVDQLTVLDFVLNAIKNCEHVRPIVHSDKKLKFVDEHDAPSVIQYREELKTRLYLIEKAEEAIAFRMSGLTKWRTISRRGALREP